MPTEQPKSNPRVLDSHSRSQLLLRISNGLAATTNLQEQLDFLIRTAREETGTERGTIFLNDSSTNELYAMIEQGDLKREVRILNTSGIAGYVFMHGRGLVVHDPYNDERFNRTVDEITEFVTNSILAAPIRTVKGEILGVIQCLNKTIQPFDEHDLELLEAMATQASIVLQSTLYIAKMEQLREVEAEFLDLVAEVSSEIQLGPLLQKIMSAVTRMLDCDRSTLFLNDERTDELYTEIGQGLGATKIRLPNNAGIAGNVFTRGRTINIPYAYADLRFNPEFDRQTGYFTRSILCVPVTNKDGKCIGVTQVLNKRGGAFTDEDEARLRAFTAQISIGLENAKLFADVQQMKNYNESILESMTNGVITTTGADGLIATCNAAGLRMLHAHGHEVIGRPVKEIFSGPNTWILEKLKRTQETNVADHVMDAELQYDNQTVSVNLTTLPLTKQTADGGLDQAENLGSLLLLEDISNEKRVKSTMARYMDPKLADQLLESGDEILGGQSQKATILFSDIRSFTTLTEELGAQGTVTLLNEYFTIMVECISREGGMLDKFIGDAIMAVFGIPVPHGDDIDRAMRTAIAMLTELNVYNQERVVHGKKPIEMGIGLNTGSVVSGNIGSPKRMDYTVIGDGVNLAARLESATKKYGARILISEHTFKNLRGTYRTREVDRVIVKGKTQPVGVHEVLDFHTKDTFPNMREVMTNFNDGLGLYREGNWTAAIEAFTAALQFHRDDTASQLYIARCRHLQQNPPALPWDGVWTFKDK